MFRLLLQLLLADLSALLVQLEQLVQQALQASAQLELRVQLDLLALLQEQRVLLAQQALARLVLLAQQARLVLKELQSMLLVQLLTLDHFHQQAQLMMRTLLLQTAIYIFGMDLLGRVSDKLLDLPVQQVLGRLAQPVLLVQPVRRDLQELMELLVLTEQLDQLAQRALVKQEQLDQLV
jgi:hypothetical protein